MTPDDEKKLTTKVGEPGDLVLVRAGSVIATADVRTALEERLRRIEQHPDEIYVRDKKFGKVGTYALTELESWDAIRHVCRFIREAVEVLCAEPFEVSKNPQRKGEEK
jgi:hypothetical protein